MERNPMAAVRLLERLEAMKARFGPAEAARAADLLERLSLLRLRGPEQLARLHEAALFLRAYPPGPRALRAADRILFDFAQRVEDPGAFDDPEISGIAGTQISAVFTHEVARRLAARHRRAVSVDWDGYDAGESFGAALAKRLPLFAEDWPVEAHPPHQEWLGKRGAEWLTANLTADEYDALRLPLEWKFGSSGVTRSRARWAARKNFYHSGPLLKRSEISLERELASAPLPVRRLPLREAGRLLDLILDSSAARYRELYGFTWPDRERLLWADAGRGMGICFFGVPPAKRLPLRAYHCGMFFKNGVPVGYVETLSLFERAEVGFNLYYTFREGETAWLYARTLRLLRQLIGVTAFSVDPYQIGHENEEGIQSGAYWFYRKLGFRPLLPEAARLTEREERRMAEQPGYRTPPPLLRRLARSGMIYGGGPEWDRFSVRQLGMRLADRQDGRAGWEDIFKAIPRFRNWPEVDREAARQLASARNLPSETRYLRLMQRNARLRDAVLRLGSS
jgi:hypothetical protein